MAATDLPSEAEGRLKRAAFSSGLTVPDFAACLQMGMRPVGLVQGFCVMQWSWYGTGSMYLRTGFGGGSSWGTTISTYSCPHGYVSGDHRSWGENFEQPWITETWQDGFNTAYKRMIEEATEAGAHGVVGVVDTTSHLIDNAIREFHLLGTAVVVEDAEAPPAIWSTYLAGQRLAKLMEAGFMPVSIAASMTSVRVWEVCTTEILLRGGYDQWGMVRPGDEVRQLSDAHMEARRRARERIRTALQGGVLHGADLQAAEFEHGEGDREVTCTIRGNAVQRVKDVAPLPAPLPTVRLS
jgi:uncharacterized protein YbjQ (UPF0145 family)